MYLRFRIHFKFVDILKEWKEIKYNQTCLVYLAISANPLFIILEVERSSFSSLSSSFSSAFFIAYLAAL